MPFGMLKNRWRILREATAHTALAPRIAVACCVLHNFVTKQRKVEPSDSKDPHPNDRKAAGLPHVRRGDPGSRIRGVLFRDFTFRSSGVEVNRDVVIDGEGDELGGDPCGDGGEDQAGRLNAQEHVRRLSQHYQQRDIVKGVEGVILTGTRQVEVVNKLCEDVSSLNTQLRSGAAVACWS
ncbi:hypothetical protein L7F22_001898 [Adiantum nelumboides]|nr:hypothetical protein [Adiantum nelumboides]